MARRSIASVPPRSDAAPAGATAIAAVHPELGSIRAVVRWRRAAAVYRERNQRRALFGTRTNSPVRQGRHQRLRRPRSRGRGESDAAGTKAAAYYTADGARRRQCRPFRLRLASRPEEERRIRSQDFDEILRDRRGRPTSSTTSSRPTRRPGTPPMSMRQALAGMLWSKQYFFFDVTTGWTSTTPIRSKPAIEMRGTRSGSTC